MNLPAICIRRPAFTIVISLVMVIIGIIGFMNLPVRWIPNVTPPEVFISTEYPGANARLVERDITKVIEGGLSGINGIEMLTSSSRQDSSFISISFKLGENMDRALEDVRSSVERMRGNLPKDAENPQVSKADSRSEAIMFIAFNDTHKSARELSDYVDQYVVPSFETLDGVGQVWVYGKRISAVRIWLDPNKMAAGNVTVDEITNLLRDQNATVPSGLIRAKDRNYSIITDTALTSVQQFNDLIIRDNQNQVLRLKDIGEAVIAPEEEEGAFRVNGKPGLALAIIPQSTANPLDVEQHVQKLFATLKRTLPQGMQASILYNQADFIRASIHSVYEAVFEAALFVWLVILIFLCSFRATFIPVITIPVCLISSLALLHFMGFSINTITLMAFVLAIGLVVDDAIVMLENISRHMETGMTAFQAALKGSKEMIFPVIAMTLTLAAVYAPIAFTPGLLGVLFREFTFTLAGAVIISGFVALTLSPMMCAAILNKVNTQNRYHQWFNHQLSKLQARYQHILEYVISKRKQVVFVLLLIAGLGLTIYHFIPAELAPSEDMGKIMVHTSAPKSASYHYTDAYVHQTEEIFNKIPEVQSYFSVINSNSAAHAFQMLMLKPLKDRKRSTDEIIKWLTAQTNMIPGIRVNVFAPPPPLASMAGSDDGDSLGLEIMTTDDYRKLQQTSAKLLEQLKPLSTFSHVDNSLKWDSEQFQVNINREKAADLHVSIPSITNTLSTLIAGKTIGKMNEANVIVQMNKTALANPNIFSQLYARNVAGNMVPLASLLSVSETSSSQVLRHYDRLRADSLYLTLAPGHKMSEAVAKLEKIAKQIIPDDMRYSFTGEAKTFMDSNGKTALTFLLALIFIYLVLVAQFESFIYPLVILFTVPFAIVGALMTLKLFGGTLNIYSNIGLITLVGLIAKHGILITDFANRLRLQGKSINEAIVQSCLLRLRPILMTTAAMVLGSLPLALASGPGAISRQQVGLVITGGLLFGTFFSLIVVPVAYTYFAPFGKLNHTTNSDEQEVEHAISL